MPITEDDLPDEWTLNYGAFMNFGDSIVVATCRSCYSLVVSDFFALHVESQHYVAAPAAALRSE